MTANRSPQPDSQPDTMLVPRSEYLPSQSTSPLDFEDGAPQRPSSLLFSYLHALRRRWFLALSLGIIVAAVASTAVWFTNRDKFTAKFQFRVLVSPESVLFNDSRAGDRNEYGIYKNTQKLYIKSDYVLTAALRDQRVSRLPCRGAGTRSCPLAGR